MDNETDLGAAFFSTDIDGHVIDCSCKSFVVLDSSFHVVQDLLAAFSEGWRMLRFRAFHCIVVIVKVCVGEQSF